MAYETVKFDVRDDGVATMTLNRPDKLNAFTRIMFDEWEEIIDRCANDDAVKVLVIAAEGRAFSSGMDLTLLGHDKSSPQFRWYYRQAHQQGFDNLEALEKPVIAAINGLCYGGGVELALSCDILFAADDASFCLIENNFGGIPASGACNRMIYYIGLAKTKEMVISGEPVGAEEAYRIGLVNHVVPKDQLLDEAYKYAAMLATKAPFAMGMAKHIINLCVNTDMHTGRYLERLGQSVLVHSEDFEEGIEAFHAKRKPVFRGK